MERHIQADNAFIEWMVAMSKNVVHIADAWYAAVKWADYHPNWISVEDELPQYGTYLVATEGNVVEISLYDIDGWDNWRGGKVTHWMPLPPPPKEETK